MLRADALEAAAREQVRIKADFIGTGEIPWGGVVGEKQVGSLLVVVT
jgi:hypothetical protein